MTENKLAKQFASSLTNPRRYARIFMLACNSYNILSDEEFKRKITTRDGNNTRNEKLITQQGREIFHVVIELYYQMVCYYIPEENIPQLSSSPMSHTKTLVEQDSKCLHT